MYNFKLILTYYNLYYYVLFIVNSFIETSACTISDLLENRVFSNLKSGIDNTSSLSRS